MNQVEECAHDVSICPIEQECAECAGPELTKIASIAALEQPHVEMEGEASSEIALGADVS